MQRPLLLIVDGESLKTPGLERALEKDGWDLAWTTSQQALNVGLMGQEPSLVILDPARGGQAGTRSILGLLEAAPRLPILMVRGPEPPPSGIPVTQFLERELAAEHWPACLKPFLPRQAEDRKLTTEDLFGDILADIGGSAAPVVSRDKPAAPPLAAATSPRTPPPQAPVRPLLVQMPSVRASGEGKPSGVAPRKPNLLPSIPTTPAKARALPPQRPTPEAPLPPAAPEGAPSFPPLSPAPAPESSLLPDLFGDILGPLVETRAAPTVPKTKNEYTLSGFSGIDDPFEARPGEPVSLLPPAALGSLGSMGNDVLDLEFIGSSDNTPATRPPQQSAASLVHQLPPKLPAAPERDAQKAPLDSASMEEFGNYYLIEKIAVGGMAELFKSRQRGVHNFEKIVAIKRILPHLSDNDEFVRMFIDEAKLAAQLTHPNIVQIFDLGKASGFYYIAMEYVDGKDLRSLLRKVREYRSPFPEAVAAYVTMKVAMALDYAHRKRGMNDKELKLVHRDVSPQNVLISSEGAVKLVDFGIAKAATKTTQTMAGALKGKLLYMSPEQALGQSLDNRSDIYSLGLVLFELLTGERCFQADSELGVLEKVRLGKVQDVQVVNPVVSKDMANILAKALQKNVDQRYGSARLMERDLKSLLVRHGNEPTDHDIAEYVNTLLKGTKEQLDALLVARFTIAPPAPAPAPVTPAPGIAKPEDPPTTVELGKALVRPEPPPESRKAGPRELPRWLLPVLLCVALALLLIVWFFARGISG